MKKNAWLREQEKEKIELHVEHLFDQIKILHEENNMRFVKINELHAKIKNHENTIVRIMISSKNLTNILDQSQTSRNKVVIGYSSYINHS